MIKTRKPVIGFYIGDVTGIGPELVARLAYSGLLTDKAIPVLIGDEYYFKKAVELIGTIVSYKKIGSIDEVTEGDALYFLDLENLKDHDIPLCMVNEKCGLDSAKAVQFMADCCKSGKLDGICLGPLNKTAIKKAGYHINGNIDLLRQSFGFQGKSGELNVVEGVFNARVTGHLPIKDIASSLTSQKIIDTTVMTNNALKQFGLESPRIAVAALNPHGGENGTCGTEEIEIIAPAVLELQNMGLNVAGPLAADTMFFQLFNKKYDAVVTMYHDQGQIAFKLRDFYHGVTVYGGLPFPVTTCAHGTAFDIAWKNIASEKSLQEAYNIVVKMAATKKSQEQ